MVHLALGRFVGFLALAASVEATNVYRVPIQRHAKALSGVNVPSTNWFYRGDNEVSRVRVCHSPLWHLLTESLQWYSTIQVGTAPQNFMSPHRAG